MYDKDLRWRQFYDRWARYYDVGIGVSALLFGFSDRGERCKMVSRLDLRPGQRVLEVSAGTGSNMPIMSSLVGNDGCLVALDLSIGMLRQCRKKLLRRRVPADLVEGEASHLPFADDAFDAVLHFGGINEFDDRGGAIEEMMRVARSGARIVFGDEGLAPGKERTLRGRLLLRMNGLYAHTPPLDLIPAYARDMRQTWFRGGGCYLIDFVNP